MKESFAQGSESLICNSFYAPIEAFSKMGKSLSRTSIALTYDEKFI
jgi:hypothetical protein